MNTQEIRSKIAELMQQAASLEALAESSKAAAMDHDYRQSRMVYGMAYNDVAVIKGKAVAAMEAMEAALEALADLEDEMEVKALAG